MMRHNRDGPQSIDHSPVNRAKTLWNTNDCKRDVQKSSSHQNVQKLKKHQCNTHDSQQGGKNTLTNFSKFLDFVFKKIFYILI